MFSDHVFGVKTMPPASSKDEKPKKVLPLEKLPAVVCSTND